MRLDYKPEHPSPLLLLAFHESPLSNLIESGWAGSSEYLFGGSLCCAMRKRELELRCEELLEVCAADFISTGDLDDLEDLEYV